jgi:RND family efflux transporter MFP subunit
MNAKLNLYLVAMLLMAPPAIAGGGHDHAANPAADSGHAHDQGAPVNAVTQWTDQLELFMEYPVTTVGEHGRFIVHLTLLEGFEPVREGTVSLEFTSTTGETTLVSSGEVFSEGTFAATVTLGEPGRHQFTLSYTGPRASATFSIDDFVVYRSAAHVPESEVEITADEIGFRKEQQWKVPFATAEVTTSQINHSIRAIADVLPAASAYVAVVAPVNGVVQVSEPGDLALPGSWVERGDVVARIVPPVQGDGWAASEIALAQAERNYERARRLREKDAISHRDFEEAENEYRARKAGHDRLEGSGNDGVLALTAPIDGQIIEWDLRPGQRVEAGDHLMAVADPTVVWLRVNVYESDMDELANPVGVYVGSGVGNGGWLVPESDLRVLTTGGSIDPVTRTVPVLLEIEQAEGRIVINGSVPVELLTSDGERGTAVPISAIYDEEGLDVVFVQIGGETFEKRFVKLGHRHAGWVRILDGVNEGERVVIQGGYHVKLASTSGAIGAGHAH